ncbi:phage tail protein [Bradyrhizobium pachyrhizi]|uniref:phage tail protein n=1 Tax=Bradyrhizobium pachyrhizi TaxID=280333 RepID=UPI00067D81EF|nr:tail fiber protein [Bradyrhizobium pachyrhizi]
MTFWKWSRTAAANGSADSTCPFPEGMAPSALNDGARGQMAALAKYRDDIAGAIVTTGTANAYAVSSYQGFDSFAHLDGQLIAFTPHITNGATVTLNVDALGAKPVRTIPGTELLSGVLIQGTPCAALYNNSDQVFYLRGFLGNPFNIPLAGGMDYWGSVVPNSCFAFPVGQAISRTTYAALFSLMGTTHGAGDGSTTFNLPDRRGRVSAMIDGGVGRLSPAGLNGNLPVMGGAGGTETVTLSTAQIPAHTHANALNDPGHSHSMSLPSRLFGNFQSFTSGGAIAGIQVNNGSDGSYYAVTVQTNMTITNASQGGGGSHPNVQPTICCNYIIRII